MRKQVKRKAIAARSKQRKRIAPKKAKPQISLKAASWYSGAAHAFAIKRDAPGSHAERK